MFCLIILIFDHIHEWRNGDLVSGALENIGNSLNSGLSAVWVLHEQVTKEHEEKTCTHLPIHNKVLTLVLQRNRTDILEPKALLNKSIKHLSPDLRLLLVGLQERLEISNRPWLVPR